MGCLRYTDGEEGKRELKCRLKFLYFIHFGFSNIEIILMNFKTSREYSVSYDLCCDELRKLNNSIIFNQKAKNVIGVNL